MALTFFVGSNLQEMCNILVFSQSAAILLTVHLSQSSVLHRSHRIV